MLVAAVLRGARWEEPAREITCLTEDLLVVVLSLTSPLDACRVTADFDVIWSHFLPSDLLRLVKGELSLMPPPS
ncbi:hypothetical protein ABZP36_031813 [Zizania latifolia]